MINLQSKAIGFALTSRRLNDQCTQLGCDPVNICVNTLLSSSSLFNHFIFITTLTHHGYYVFFSHAYLLESHLLFNCILEPWTQEQTLHVFLKGDLCWIIHQTTLTLTRLLSDLFGRVWVDSAGMTLCSDVSG